MASFSTGFVGSSVLKKYTYDKCLVLIAWFNDGANYLIDLTGWLGLKVSISEYNIPSYMGIIADLKRLSLYR